MFGYIYGLGLYMQVTCLVTYMGSVFTCRLHVWLHIGARSLHAGYMFGYIYGLGLYMQVTCLVTYMGSVLQLLI